MASLYTNSNRVSLKKEVITCIKNSLKRFLLMSKNTPDKVVLKLMDTDPDQKLKDLSIRSWRNGAFEKGECL
jgi:hypothetical protein